MSTTCIPPARHIRTDDIPEEYRDIVDAIGMEAFVHLTLLCGGMSELIAKNGGIAWIIQKLRKVYPKLTVRCFSDFGHGDIINHPELFVEEMI